MIRPQSGGTGSYDGGFASPFGGVVLELAFTAAIGLLSSFTDSSVGY
jgi:hypothetical protein